MDDIHDFGTVKSLSRTRMSESILLLSTRLHGMERENFTFYRNQTTMPSVTQMKFYFIAQKGFKTNLYVKEVELKKKIISCLFGPYGIMHIG
jgi:hypothetical protein